MIFDLPLKILKYQLIATLTDHRTFILFPKCEARVYHCRQFECILSVLAAV